MRSNILILISISLFALATIPLANATTFTDNFVDASQWTIPSSSGAYTISGNTLTFTDTSKSSSMTLNQGTFATNKYDLQFDMAITYYTTTSNYLQLGLYGSSGNRLFVQAMPWYNSTYESNSFWINSGAVNQFYTPKYTYGSFHHYEIYSSGTGLYYYIDNTLHYQANTAAPSTTGAALTIAITNGNGNFAIKNFYFDSTGIPQQPFNYLYVNVQNATSAAVIPGAIVTLLYANGTMMCQAIANSTGIATLPIPQAAAHSAFDLSNLTITANGYSPYYQTAAWANACQGGSYSTSIQLSPGPVALMGYVYDLTDLSTLAGATVTVKWPNGTTMATSVSDNTGYYSVNIPGGAPQGIYNETAALTGFVTSGLFGANYPTTWSGNSSYEHDIFLQETIPAGKAQLVINVVNKNTNASISGATVQTYLTDYSATPVTYTTNNMGTVTAIVAQGTYQIKANAGASYSIASGQILASGQYTYTIVLQLIPIAPATPTPVPAQFYNNLVIFDYDTMYRIPYSHATVNDTTIGASAEYDLTTGNISILWNKGHVYNVTGSASNYNNNTVTFTPLGNDQQFGCGLHIAIPTPTPVPDGGSISKPLEIRDAATNQGLPGSTINIYDARTASWDNFTMSMGQSSWTYNWISGDQYTITASHNGYISLTVGQVVRDANTPSVILALNPITTQYFTGHVYDADNNAAIQAAAINIRSYGNNIVVAAGVTNGAGSYSLTASNLSRGLDCTMEVSASGYQTITYMDINYPDDFVNGYYTQNVFMFKTMGGASIQPIATVPPSPTLDQSSRKAYITQSGDFWAAGIMSLGILGFLGVVMAIFYRMKEG